METEKVKIERVLVTPHMAREFLKKNSKNRGISRQIVNSYVQAMKKDQWREDTGETIKFSETGVLIDGQHRLTALINFDKPFYFHVVTGVKDSVFSILDTGKKRNGSDSLHVSNVPNAATVAGAITSFILFNKNLSYGANRRDIGISNEDIINEYFSRPAFWDYLAKEGRNLYKDFNHAIVPAQLVGFWAVLSDINQDKADVFIKKLCTGLGFTSDNDPIYQLRKILQAHRSNSTRLTSSYKTALLIKGWNLFVTNKTVRLFTHNPQDPYPKLIKTIPETKIEATSGELQEA